MNKFIEKLPKFTLWALFAISLVIAGFFIFGGQIEFDEGIGEELLSAPVHTEMFLNWTYALFAIAVIATLVASVFTFVTNFRKNPKKGIGTLAVLVVFALVFVISWAIGSPEKLEIIGYEGTDNVGFWAQYADMCMYATIIFASATILALLGSTLYSKIKG
jgi:FtsH-binding integral membrane protein